MAVLELNRSGARSAPVTERAGPGGTARTRRFSVGDVVAGVSVALVLIPQALAYSGLAGLPPVNGLYAAAIPLVAAAAFASSPYLQTGPVAITSLLTLGALSPIAQEGTAGYVSLALLLALVVGVMRVGLGLMRAGVVAYLMSQPMLMGFIPAAALLISGSQLPKAFGMAPHSGDVIPDALHALAHPGAWHPAAMLLTAVTLILMLGGRRLHPLFPGVLAAVVVGILSVKVAHYGGLTVGSIPAQLPPVSLDLPWSQVPDLILPGLVIALVGFAEPASISRTFAAMEREPWDANREFVSQGVANVASGLTGGYPIGGSFSRSSLNRLAGARSRWSGAVTGLVVLAFLPFADLLKPLPEAVLAGAVIGAVAQLIRIRRPAQLWRFSKPQFGIAWVTFGLTLAFSPHVERGVLAGIALSIVIHLWRELRIEVEAAGSVEDGTLRLAPRGVLWFGAAQELEDVFLGLLAEHRDAERLRIDLDGLGRIDVSGAIALHKVVRAARDSGLEVEVGGGPPQSARLVRDLVERERIPFGD